MAWLSRATAVWYSQPVPRSWRQPLHRCRQGRDAPQEEDGLLTEAVNRTILGGFSALYEQLVQEYHVVPVTDPDFELLAVNRAEGFRRGRSSTRCRRWQWEHTPVSCNPLEPPPHPAADH